MILILVLSSISQFSQNLQQKSIQRCSPQLLEPSLPGEPPGPNQVNNQQASRLAGRLAGPYFTCAIFTPPPSPTAILPWGIGCVTGARLLPLAAAGLGCSMHQNQVHRPTEILDQGRGVTGPGYCSQRRRRKPAARGAQAVKQSEPGVIAASQNRYLYLELEVYAPTSSWRP